MTRLAVISDSHWGKVRLEMFSRIVRAEQFDGIIHLGDGQSDAKWLEKEKDSFEGKVAAMPQRDDIDFEVAEHLIVELYSK